MNGADYQHELLDAADAKLAAIEHARTIANRYLRQWVQEASQLSPESYRVLGARQIRALITCGATRSVERLHTRLVLHASQIGCSGMRFSIINAGDENSYYIESRTQSP